MLLTVQQVQERLNISRSLTYRLIERGELPSHRIGSSIRVSEEDLAAYLERSKVKPAMPNLDQLPTVQLRNLRV